LDAEVGEKDVLAVVAVTIAEKEKNYRKT